MIPEGPARVAIGTPALALAAPFFVFASHNAVPWTSPALWAALAGVAIPGLALGALGALAGLPGRVAALALALALATDLHLRTSSGQEKALAAALAAGAVVGAGLAFRDRLFAPAAAFLGVVIATTPIAQQGPPLVREAGARVTAPSALPPILHVILDEQAGADAIPAESDPGGRLRTMLVDDYVARGFRVYPRAISRYYDSYNSIPNTLNLASPARDGAHLADTGDDESRVLAENAWFERLAARGYRFRVVQTSYLDFTRSRGVPVEHALTYEIHAVGVIADLDLPLATRAGLLLDAFAKGSRVVRQFHEARIPGVVAIPSATALRRLADDLGATDDRGVVTFVHVTIPHYTHLFDEKCVPRASVATWTDRRARRGGAIENSPAERRERYDRYVEQSLCAQRLIGGVFDALRAKGAWDDAIVVVHGDHGSRITTHPPYTKHRDALTPQDHRDAFGTFLAVKAPGFAPGASDVPFAVQDALAAVLDGREPEPAPPYVFVGPSKGKFRKAPYRGWTAE